MQGSDLMFYESMVAYLVANAGLSALVGDRLTPGYIPQEDALPAISYTDIGGETFFTLAARQKLKEPIYQFKIYATTYAGAMAVYAALNTALENYSGTMGSYEVQEIQLQDEPIHDWEEETKSHVITVEYKFSYVDT